MVKNKKLIATIVLVHFFYMNFVFALSATEMSISAPKVDEPVLFEYSFPTLPENKIVAHRGGSIEKGCPDNSIEALNYAIDLGCYASECDVYLTKDERVIVAHA